jgi:lysophospholipase L1-like esterase
MPRRILRILKWQLGLLLLLFALGELLVRRHYEGSFVAAARAVWGGKRPTANLDAGQMVELDPELGYRLNRRRGGVNSLGLLGPEITRDKPAGTARILVLGDSVAMDQAGFVTMLRARLATWRGQPVEVINGAVFGYTTFQERRWFERDLVALRPDFVLLQHCLNDNHRFLHQLTDDGRFLVTQEARRTLLTDGWASRWFGWSWLLFELRLRLAAPPAGDGAGYPWDAVSEFHAAWQDRTWPEAAEHLRAIQAACQAIGAGFAVLSVPFEPQLDPVHLDRDRAYTLKPQRKLAEACAASGIRLLDWFEEFRALRQEKLFTDRIHLTARGHELVATKLLEFFAAEK